MWKSKGEAPTSHMAQKLEGSARYLGKMVGDGALQVEERKDESWVLGGSTKAPTHKHAKQFSWVGIKRGTKSSLGARMWNTFSPTILGKGLGDEESLKRKIWACDRVDVWERYGAYTQRCERANEGEAPTSHMTHKLEGSARNLGKMMGDGALQVE